MEIKIKAKPDRDDYSSLRYRVTPFSAAGHYPRGIFSFPTAAFVADEEVVFAVTHCSTWRSQEDLPYSEVDWMKPEIVRLLGSLMFCERFTERRCCFYPRVHADVILGNDHLDLQDHGCISQIKAAVIGDKRFTSPALSKSEWQGVGAEGYLFDPGELNIDLCDAYAPQVVRDAMQPVIQQVLAQRNQALLTIGVLATLWTASSGMQAVRSALNRAYGIERGLPFWKARIKSTLFTVVVGAGVLAAFSSVVVMPYVWALLEKSVGAGQDTVWLRNSVRYGSAYVVLTVLYALLYGWLPDIRQRIYTVMPGALMGAALWVAAAATLSYTLRSAGKLALLYGSFAGVVATLVFLYISATTLIFGAEINGVLREKVGGPSHANP
ncbi:YihY/virulence factor BrkB family protein [Variovorax sp. N23]|uniref:YihY/virulence factor BrkB family protein n=1 Tax=Variovorax sp. N23 TaxID=2980555 RepID=UPI0021C9AB2B|nr:YihY/virulence factor BrkB family protein [Variovorax sp. N23]MCU4122011.1 YihY/virulence factor BrkB family protein [Variovorax sp. N23]